MRIWGSPGHYIQGAGVIEKLHEYANSFGSTHLYIVDEPANQTVAVLYVPFLP